MKLRSLLFAGTGLAVMLDFPLVTVASGVGDFSLEEIVVTARRKEEKIQEVPVAVTALTGGDMREQRIFRQEDLQYTTPGLSVNQVTVQNNLTYNLRGQGQAFGGSAPGVQTYFDEVPLVGGVFQYYDVDRVEVLRGPQGTLFGRNTTGGAVRLIPKRPSLKSFDGYTEADMGNLNARTFEGAINAPIGDKLAIRLAGNYTGRDGYVQNITTNQ